MNILTLRTNIVSQKWGEKNQKFVWLKVASVNISHSTVYDCIPFPMASFLIAIEWNESFFKPKEKTFQENHFQNT
jgi:hypothetical protein